MGHRSPVGKGGIGLAFSKWTALGSRSSVDVRGIARKAARRLTTLYRRNYFLWLFGLLTAESLTHGQAGVANCRYSLFRSCAFDSKNTPMAQTLFQIFPNPEDLLSLPPEVLAGILVENIPELPSPRGSFSFHGDREKSILLCLCKNLLALKVGDVGDTAPCLPGETRPQKAHRRPRFEAVRPSLRLPGPVLVVNHRQCRVCKLDCG